MTGFFSAGEYAAFVWPAYGITLFGLAAAVMIVWRLYRRARTRLQALDRPPDRETSYKGRTEI